MIHLDEKNLIGKGRDRACYAHPENVNACIKVSIKPEKQSIREKKYLRYLSKKDRNLSFISNYLGQIETSNGTGHQYELVRDFEGNIAPTLKEAIQSDLISIDEINDIVKRVKHYLINELICVYDLSPNNVCVYKDKKGNWQFKIIDGLGVSTWNPATERVKLLAESLIQKSHNRLIDRIDKTLKYKRLNMTPKPKKRNSKILQTVRSFTTTIGLLIPFIILYFGLAEGWSI